MKKSISLILASAMLCSALAACSSSEDTTAADTTAADTATEATADASAFKVGVILVGDENEAYTYAHIEGIEYAKEELGLTDDQIIYKYNIATDESCYDAAVDLVEQGCTMVISNSFSHESFMLQAAEEYPDVTFAPATGNSAETYGLDNVVNYFTKVYESRYVSGVVAGMKLAEMLESGEATDAYLGYVGAYPYAEVMSGYTAFFLGVQSIVPEAHMDVAYTNSWFDITAEAEAANALIARGAVILSQHADSTGAPSAVQAAYEAGNAVYCVGYNVDMLSIAPDAALTSAQNVWGVQYENIFSTFMNGEDMAYDYAYGYAEDGVKISALGDSCAEGTAEKVAEVEAAIAAGELHVFDITTFTVNGETVESYDTVYGYEGREMIWDGYFHESELRSAPTFELAIDGITQLS